MLTLTTLRHTSRSGVSLLGVPGLAAGVHLLRLGKAFPAGLGSPTLMLEAVLAAAAPAAVEDPCLDAVVTTLVPLEEDAVAELIATLPFVTALEEDALAALAASALLTAAGIAFLLLRAFSASSVSLFSTIL